MPLKPKVPHIVGDDDEMSDVNDQAQISVAGRITPQIVTETSSSMAYGEESESSSSERSESSDDDSSDSDDEGANSSTKKDEEEEDWSNNISYIVRTPLHKHDCSRSTSAISGSIVASEMETETETAELEVELTTDEATTEAEDSNNIPEMLTFTVPSSPEEESCNATRSSPDVETEPVNEDCEQLTAPSVLIPNMENKVLDLSPAYRRRSLRSATRSNPAKSSAPPKKAVARPRQRKRKVYSMPTSPNSIGARVAKRPRHSKGRTKSPVKNSDAPLARPVEVTEYFTSISATLVSHRIKKAPFLYLRGHIDRLVGEALAKNKMP